jgi:hypothetical protein
MYCSAAASSSLSSSAAHHHLIILIIFYYYIRSLLSLIYNISHITILLIHFIILATVLPLFKVQVVMKNHYEEDCDEKRGDYEEEDNDDTEREFESEVERENYESEVEDWFESDEEDDEDAPKPVHYTLAFLFHQNSKTKLKGKPLEHPLIIINNHRSERWPDKLCECLRKHCEQNGANQVVMANLIEDCRQYVNNHHPTPAIFKQFLMQYLEGNMVFLSVDCNC